MRGLVFDLDLYFNRLPGAVEVDLSLLEPSRYNDYSIQRAWNYMSLAAKGEIRKRDPIKVIKNDRGKFEILDGNSTFAVAAACDWPKILILETRNAHCD